LKEERGNNPDAEGLRKGRSPLTGKEKWPGADPRNGGERRGMSRYSRNEEREGFGGARPARRSRSVTRWKWRVNKTEQKNRRGTGSGGDWFFEGEIEMG